MFLEELPLEQILSTSSSVPCYSFIDDFDKDASDLTFAWIRWVIPDGPSPEEQRDTNNAILEQFHKKIINKYGYPYGMPKDKNTKMMIEEISKNNKPSKWDKKRMKMDIKATKKLQFDEKYLGKTKAI